MGCKFKSSDTLRSFCRDETGATHVMEFVLTFPFLLTIIALVCQIALLVHAQILVQYAAFNAARSAIVWIPADLDRERRNRISTGSRSTKREHIRDAAAISCLPITPKARSIGSAGLSKIAFLEERLRLKNARELTSVTLEKSKFKEDDPITVTVEHEYVLRVPIAGRILGKYKGITSTLLLGSSFVKPLKAHATLLNQGGDHGCETHID